MTDKQMTAGEQIPQIATDLITVQTRLKKALEDARIDVKAMLEREGHTKRIKDLKTQRDVLQSALEAAVREPNQVLMSGV